MTQRFRVFAPASVSNLGPGFDVLGLALHQLGDIVEAELADQPGVSIEEVTGDEGRLSRDARVNVVGVAAAHVLERARARVASGAASADTRGIRLRLHKQMPMASGLGSSGASSAAGAFAANEALDRPFSREELVASAMEGERVATGDRHADNVAPALLGGIVLIRSYTPLELLSLPVPAHLRIVVAHPHCDVSTAAARAILRDRAFRLGDIVANQGNLAALVHALHRSDLELLGRAIEDHLVEPARRGLIPGFAQVRAAACEAGALGCSISGSGPTLFALCASDEAGREIGNAMRDAFRSAAGLDSDIHVGAINILGACRIE